MIDRDGVEQLGDETSGLGGIGEKCANEANCGETMSVVEPQESLQVMASSGARSRLDKRGGAARGAQHAAGSCPSCRGWPVNEPRGSAPQPGAHGMSVAFSKIPLSRVFRARTGSSCAVVWVTLCVLVQAAVLARSAARVGSGYPCLRFGLVCRGCYPQLNHAESLTDTFPWHWTVRRRDRYRDTRRRFDSPIRGAREGLESAGLTTQEPVRQHVTTGNHCTADSESLRCRILRDRTGALRKRLIQSHFFPSSFAFPTRACQPDQGPG